MQSWNDVALLQVRTYLLLQCTLLAPPPTFSSPLIRFTRFFFCLSCSGTFAHIDALKIIILSPFFYCFTLTWGVSNKHTPEKAVAPDCALHGVDNKLKLCSSFKKEKKKIQSPFVCSLPLLRVKDRDCWSTLFSLFPFGQRGLFFEVNNTVGATTYLRTFTAGSFFFFFTSAVCSTNFWVDRNKTSFFFFLLALLLFLNSWILR